MVFSPGRTAIAAITQAKPTAVTTETAHGLVTGQIVRLHVPPAYGMYQLNQGIFNVVVTSTTTFTLQNILPPLPDIDSESFTAFTIPSNPQFTAEVIPMGQGLFKQLQPDWAATNDIAVKRVEDATRNITRVNIPF